MPTQRTLVLRDASLKYVSVSRLWDAEKGRVFNPTLLTFTWVIQDLGGQDWDLGRLIDPAGKIHDYLVGKRFLKGLKTSREAAS